MIDIENKIITTLKNAITTYDNTIKVYTEYVQVAESFPVVTIIEESNTTYRKSLDIAKKEHHANLLYSINVYTNDDNGRKQRAKNIANVIDAKMLELNFTKTQSRQIPNVEKTIFRYLLQYEAIVEEGKTSGTTTTYKIYRK